MATELFPRASRYADEPWAKATPMGPNAMWLMESLCLAADLAPGMRVMDLGCGRAVSSIFLTREFGVDVWATDLWIPPTENWERVQEADLAANVFPIHADARSLPYPHGYFDAILSVDAYHYFGTDDMYLEYLVRFLRPGGLLGIVVPGFKREPGDDVPEHLRQAYHHEQWHSFHSPAWWRRHFEKTAAVRVTCADEAPGSWEIWKAFADGPESGTDRDPILADQGSLLTFSRVVAVRT